MAKLLGGELEIKLELTRDGTGMVVACSAHYGVEAEEYGISMRKGLPIELTPAQETAVKSFASQVVAKIKEYEGVA